MNGSLVRIGAFAFLVVLASIAGIVFSQMADLPEEPQPKKDHIVAPPAATAAKESGAREDNVVKLSNPDDERENAIAGLLKSQPTPSTRATYFQSILNSPDFRFKRWYLTLLKVKTADGVTRFNVRAVPLVTSRFAGITVVNGFLDETYELKGEDLKLVKTDPTVDPRVVTQFGFDGF